MIYKFGVFLEACESTPRPKVKMLPWRVMGKKMFWSRDRQPSQASLGSLVRLVKHEFNCLGLGLGSGLGLGNGIASGLWLGLGFM